MRPNNYEIMRDRIEDGLIHDIDKCDSDINGKSHNPDIKRPFVTMFEILMSKAEHDVDGASILLQLAIMAGYKPGEG